MGREIFYVSWVFWVEKRWSRVFFKYFFGVPHLATCIFLFFYTEPELGVGIDPGMALTPLPSSIGLDRDQTHNLSIVSRALYH